MPAAKLGAVPLHPARKLFAARLNCSLWISPARPAAGLAGSESLRCRIFQIACGREMMRRKTVGRTGSAHPPELYDSATLRGRLVPATWRSAQLDPDDPSGNGEVRWLPSPRSAAPIAHLRLFPSAIAGAPGERRPASGYALPLPRRIGTGDARKVHDPVGLPGLPAVIREGLLPTRRGEVDPRPDIANLDRSPVEQIFAEELTAIS